MRALDGLAGTWDLEAVFPANPDQVLRGGQTYFEWLQGRNVLIQRTPSPAAEVPESIALMTADDETGGFRQHYFDSRGVARLYAMTLRDGTWTLLRESADFSPLAFAQRFRGTFEDGGRTIRGFWEKRDPGGDWAKDFDLIYRKADERT